MTRKNFKKKQVDTTVEVLKGQLEEMKPPGHCITFVLAAFVLVVAVCVVPLAALCNCKYTPKTFEGPLTLGVYRLIQHVTMAKQP